MKKIGITYIPVQKWVIPLVGIALLALVVTPAQANLNDPPYFNLWSGDIGGPGNTTLSGNGSSIELCGVATNKCNGSQAGLAIFEAVDTKPAGTGVVRPFLRFQHDTAQGQSSPTQPYLLPNDGNATGVEGAYNTDSRSRADGEVTVHGLEYDGDFLNQAHDTNQWNHSLKLADLVDNGGHYDFYLDINEPGSDGQRTLHLDELNLESAVGRRELDESKEEKRDRR